MVEAGPDMVMIGRRPMTPAATEVINLAIGEARDLDHNYVGTEHLLLGLARQKEGIAAQVLTSFQVDDGKPLTLERVREEVCNLLGHKEDEPKIEAVSGVSPALGIYSFDFVAGPGTGQLGLLLAARVEFPPGKRILKVIVITD